MGTLGYGRLLAAAAHGKPRASRRRPGPPSIRPGGRLAPWKVPGKLPEARPGTQIGGTSKKRHLSLGENDFFYCFFTAPKKRKKKNATKHRKYRFSLRQLKKYLMNEHERHDYAICIHVRRFANLAIIGTDHCFHKLSRARAFISCHSGSPFMKNRHSAKSKSIKIHVITITKGGRNRPGESPWDPAYR